MEAGRPSKLCVEWLHRTKEAKVRLNQHVPSIKLSVFDRGGNRISFPEGGTFKLCADGGQLSSLPIICRAS